MNIHLFSGSGFAWRVLLACAVKNIPYDQSILQPTQEALKSPGFLALNPRGKVPVMEDDGFVLSESMAIIAYLDCKYPDTPLLGTSARECGLIWQKILDFDVYVSAKWVSDIIAPIVIGNVNQNPTSVQQASAEAHVYIKELQASLGTNDWFVGKTVSAIDIALFPMLEALVRFATKPQAAQLVLGFEGFADLYPILEAWRVRMRKLPRFEDTYPDYWRKISGG